MSVKYPAGTGRVPAERPAAVPPAEKPNKYHAGPKDTRTDKDGIVYDSKKEMLRGQQLDLLQKAGEISGLRRQVRLRIEVDGQKICDYVADFVYYENGKQVTEDVKGFQTPIYRLKKRLVEVALGIEIWET